jgi:ABC-type antimicrobial peptide transport system permease subunit
VRRIAHAIDPAVPLTIRRPDERAFESTLLPLLGWLTRALATIGIGALALSTVGIFSVVAFSVAQRTREIGLRTALGATQASIVSLVLRRSVRLALAGIVLGVLGAAACGRVLASMLFGVSPFDLASLIAVAAAVTIVTLVAAWQPARRAADADPAAALREE